MCALADPFRHGDLQAKFLDPFMIHELFPSPTETAFGRHPCRVVSVTYRTLRPFHNEPGDISFLRPRLGFHRSRVFGRSTRFRRSAVCIRSPRPAELSTW